MKAITPEQYHQAPREQRQGGAKPEGGQHVIEYRILNGTAYHAATPLAVVQVLEQLRASRAIVRVFLGETETGLDWNEECDTVGRVDRSTGRIKIPLLVPPNDSGGPGLLDHCIVRLLQARNGRELYRHPQYRCRDFRIEDEPCAGHPDLRATVYRAGEVIARFQSRVEAEHWVRFMRGEVMTSFDPKTQSAKRAERARQMLAPLVLPEAEALVELLADLRHYCFRHRLDFGEAIARATRDFETERHGLYP
jgi:hypothetical protein